VAILGWGSLVWDPRQLHVATPWELTDLRLPLEFSRISQRERRLTLVIDTNDGAECGVYYALSALSGLPDAIADLAEREETDVANIGVATQDTTFNAWDPRREIVQWVVQKAFEAAIWTDLEPNFPRRRRGQPFSIPEALAHLADLNPVERAAARRYIVNAPASVQTPLRQRLIADGWR
jgi:hypothetical protein